MDANETTLDNFCGGSLKEILEVEFLKISANIGDPNTSAKAPRKLTLTFIFKPYPDRSGASVHIEPPKEGLAGLDTSECVGTVYFAKRDGKFRMFSRDMRQELLFADKDEMPVDGKTAGAGD